MRRTLPWLVAVIVTVTLVAGCSGSSPSTPASNETVLVLGGSLNSQLAAALEGTGGLDVHDATDVNVLVGDNPLFDWRSEWRRAVRTVRPQVVVVSATQIADPCAPFCQGFSPESRREAFRSVIEVLEGVPVIVWVGFPAVGPGGASTWISGEPNEIIAQMNAVDEEEAKKAGIAYVSAMRVLDGWQTLRRAPDGETYQARRSDQVHYCPVAAGAIAEAVIASAWPQGSPVADYSQWWKGDWWRTKWFVTTGLGAPCEFSPTTIDPPAG